MDYTVSEALALLRTVGEGIREHQAQADTGRLYRDQLVTQLYGQEGMTGAAIADAALITRDRVNQIVAKYRGPRPEGDDTVTVSDELREQLEALTADA